MPVTGSAISRWVSFTIRRGRSDAGDAIIGNSPLWNTMIFEPFTPKNQIMLLPFESVGRRWGRDVGQRERSVESKAIAIE